MPHGVTHCFPLHITVSRTGDQMYTVRRMRCLGGISNTTGGGVGGVGEREKCVQAFRGGKLKERGHFENIGIDVRMIKRQTFKKWAVKAWTGLIWLRIGASRELL